MGTPGRGSVSKAGDAKNHRDRRWASSASRALVLRFGQIGHWNSRSRQAGERNCQLPVNLSKTAAVVAIKCGGSEGPSAGSMGRREQRTDPSLR